MADQEEPQSLASTFPNPPPFWRDFTAGRVARFDDLRARQGGGRGIEDDGGDADDGPVRRLTDVPDDLANLQPPPEPADGRWRVFGDQYMLDDKLPTLEEQGITNLPDTAPATNPAGGEPPRDGTHYDRALELKRLAKSLLLNFLELSGALGRAPARAEDKVQDLRTLFINAHHALNEYRPHQARESAMALMQHHLDRARTETAAVRAQVDAARRVLEGLGSLRVAAEAGGGDARLGGDGGAEGVEEGDRDALLAQREAEVWAATDAVFA